jgi:acetyl-CoA synthetase
MLPNIRNYPRLVADFSWSIPERFNIGVACCDAWAQRAPDQAAVLEVDARGNIVPLTYAQLRVSSNRLANALMRRGISAGDRVAILLPQSAMVPIVHMAIYKIGAIAMPLAALFGPDALSYRLRDSGARTLITNAAGLAKLDMIRSDITDLDLILSTDGADGQALGLDAVMQREDSDFSPLPTYADDPAMMIYTSGTTGQPKGALHAHRVLLGHLPGVQMPHDFLPQEGDRLWTPADWAWAGGLLNVLLPGLYFGVPVVARKFDKFDAEEGFRLIADLKVRNVFVPPTALRMLRSVNNPRGRFDINLRTLASGGEALGAATYEWGREVLGLTINEFYGQTECNLVLASSTAMGVSKAGFIGKPVPGHAVGIIHADGSSCATDEEGEIAVLKPDPVMFLGYWNNPKATADKFVEDPMLGSWMKTGDRGVVDREGYIRFVGRDDDVITSSGYRIGPGEIEDCLIKHPAVSLAAVVGKPDELRTEIVKAFVVLKAGYEPSDALVADISAFVRMRLSAHEYPREIVFRDDLPLTTTGKVIRRLLRDEG